MNFSFKRVGKTILIIVIGCVFVTGIVLAVISRPVKIAWASIIYNRREHYWSCEELPFYPQVQKALIVHADVVEKLKAAGASGVEAEKKECTNFEGGIVFIKGDIGISYGSRGARSAIEKIIGDNFFGIPYRGREYNN